MDIDLRMDRYDFHYQFRENPQEFDWSFHPERIIIKNEALRTGDSELYQRYLKVAFPHRMEAEISAFNLTAERLQHLPGDDAFKLLRGLEVNILRSDIHWEEDDAIFTAKIIPDLDISFLVGDADDEQLILNYVYPSWITNRKSLWLDLSELQ
ncbi:hypothetical protein [Sphingobacterium deserti]|uniref:Uncharacterized protein n=1 Tax=Sphingobacterium deserti TaxID=1229276 RepID=A0A0B8T545_9SPHI|nr:hypothetical protein [Sphingobacterium deserti]KGE12544.1 hypothetical protein DI53_3584 [Sphingobacterium deserti]